MDYLLPSPVYFFSKWLGNTWILRLQGPNGASTKYMHRGGEWRQWRTPRNVRQVGPGKRLNANANADEKLQVLRTFLQLLAAVENQAATGCQPYVAQVGRWGRGVICQLGPSAEPRIIATTRPWTLGRRERVP